MRSNFHGGGPLDPPSGQVTVETPDGVTKTFGGGTVTSNLMNGSYVHGGVDACAYGAWPEENDSQPMALSGPSSDRFRIG